MLLSLFHWGFLTHPDWSYSIAFLRSMWRVWEQPCDSRSQSCTKIQCVIFSSSPLPCSHYPLFPPLIQPIPIGNQSLYSLISSSCLFLLYQWADTCIFLTCPSFLHEEYHTIDILLGSSFSFNNVLWESYYINS